MSVVQEHAETLEDSAPVADPPPAAADASAPTTATTSGGSDRDRRASVSVPSGHRLLDTWRRHPLARPCTSYVLSRVAVLFAALGAKWLAPKLHLLNALTAGWDGKWYQLIAQHGYPSHIVNEGHGSRWAFFPAWPLIIRATVGATHLSYSQATVFLSFVLGLTSAIAVWLAVREVFGQVIADRAVLLYVFFPASFVLSLGYSEGLFITACGVCLYALSRRYWLTAALAAAIGGLTRDFGIVLIACVVVAAGHAFIRTRKARPLVAVMVAPLGLALWLGYSWSTVGTPFAFLQAERFWGNGHFVWFVTPFLAVFDMLTHAQALEQGQVVMCVLGVAFAYLGIILLAKARDSGVSIPPAWWVFTVLSTLAVLSSYEPDSVLRYSMVVITAYAAYAWRMRPAWEGRVVGMLGMAQGMFMVVALLGSQHPHTAALWP
jgi:hypothetical protein